MPIHVDAILASRAGTPIAQHASTSMIERPAHVAIRIRIMDRVYPPPRSTAMLAIRCTLSLPKPRLIIVEPHRRHDSFLLIQSNEQTPGTTPITSMIAHLAIAWSRLTRPISYTTSSTNVASPSQRNVCNRRPMPRKIPISEATSSASQAPKLANCQIGTASEA